MVGRILWAAISCLMVLSLIMTACGQVTTTPATPTTPSTPATKTAPTTPEEKPAQKEVVEPSDDTVRLTLKKKDGTTIEKRVEKPQYGGTLTLAKTSDRGEFDSAKTGTRSIHPSGWVYSELMTGDWSIGPAGTEETNWTVGLGWRTQWWRGQLADSFELPDDETIIFNIHKGARWALDPDSEASRVMGGREFTAEDAAFAFMRMWTTPGNSSYSSLGPEERLISAKALDKYTLELKVPAHVQGQHVLLAGDLTYMAHPPEVIAKYGDMSNWRNTVGTGPFMLKDYVPDSSSTFVRNPDYFETDPLFPENHLPYVDKVQWLIIPDLSTRLAALRTGKLDLEKDLIDEDAQALKKVIPEMDLIPVLPTAASSVIGRMDKEELPFRDVRVRKALSMAINRQDMVNYLYNGKALLFGYPYIQADNPDIFVPLEDMSQEAREVFSYNPDRAKQLLAEAGYPNGFKTQIMISAANVDLMAIVKEYYAAIGVEMELDVREAGVVSAQSRQRTYPEMVYTGTYENWTQWRMFGVRPEADVCVGLFPENPTSRAAYDELQQNIGKNDAEVARILKGMTEFYVEQVVWGTVLPLPYSYDAHWPWLKNFHGERNIGYYSPNEPERFMWIDQSLKKEMGY